MRFVEGCPNVAVARQRLHLALDAVGRGDIDIRLLVVRTDAEAAELGFTGSPTILIDGSDPFVHPHAKAGLSCRLYSTAEGVAGSPSVEQLTAALSGADQTRVIAMSVDDSAVDRAEIPADLEQARVEFHRLVAEAERHDAWATPTRGTQWTNEQLLFHMVFGYIIVQRLLVLVNMFNRLPDQVSRGFARLLNAATRPFDAINYYGSRSGALVYNRRRMGAKMDRVIAALQRKLAHESDDTLRRGMHFPTRWDPFFTDYMTLADVYRYPGHHFDFHERQLTIGDTP